LQLGEFVVADAAVSPQLTTINTLFVSE